MGSSCLVGFSGIYLERLVQRISFTRMTSVAACMHFVASNFGLVVGGFFKIINLKFFLKPAGVKGQTN